MLFTEKRTKKEWTVTADQAKELAKELNYIADEANDHQRPHYSQIIVDGGFEGLKSPFRIIALPDEEKEND